MASKYRLENSRNYLEGTDIPHNKLGISNSEELHELERALVEEAYQVFYNELDDSTAFDEAYFKSLHRRTFESLYEWAGVYRHFNMAKGSSRFCQGDYVESSSHKLFAEMAKADYLKIEGRSKVEFIQELAYFKCELIALHPFYELNGRITRLFVDLIALRNGYRAVDYSGISPESYINASIECVQFADCKPMEKIIADGLNDVLPDTFILEDVELGLLGEQSRSAMTGQAADQAEALLHFCNEPRSTKEMMQYLGLSHHPHFRHRLLLPLIASGKLALTIPDKPKSPKQRYIATMDRS
jgi:cell filamentation protein